MRRKMAITLVLVTASLLSSPAIAQEFATLFNDTVDGRRLIAVATGRSFDLAADLAALIEELQVYAGRDITVLAYSDHETASEIEPVVVFVDGVLLSSTTEPGRSTTSPTIGESIKMATTTERGDHIGAICADGSRTTAVHDRACIFNDGVAERLYSAMAITDTGKVVGAICADHRLVSGEGGRCGNAKVVARISAKTYPQPTPAPPEPVPAHPVAPLPPETEPAAASLEPPTIERSEVEWTVREAGKVGFVWSAAVANPNPVPIRAVAAVRLRDAAGAVIHSDEHELALGPGETLAFADEGSVAEEATVDADRWTFDVAFAAPEARAEEQLPSIPAADVAGRVILSVDLLTEEARITNAGSDELDLDRWSLVSLAGGESFTFRFFKLGAGESVVLTSGAGARSKLPEFYLWTARSIWEDAGDVGELRDAQGRVRARTNPDGSPGH